MTVQTFPADRDWPIASLLKNTRAGSPVLWWSMIIMMVLAAAFATLQMFDSRELANVNVWVKPTKFAISIGLQFATVAWGLSLLPDAGRKRAWFAPQLLLWTGWLELLYIVFRAARGEASHFNTSTMAAGIAYSLMGVGAVCMVAATFAVGWRLWKQRKTSIISEAAAFGLMLGSVLGGAAGIYLGNKAGHFVSPATGGIGLFGWSTSGGDWRVAHFAGLHAAQIIPLAAHILPRRGTIYIAGALITAVTLAVFVQAWLDLPLLRA